ncbi:hypothetical protein [Aristaeella hokkaidonensis]|uniref:Uncharacterized protein n=1 Tax=Aristaeella hokkaidonensis TaxID=3046382 RepID=A0AC61MWS2_9FIRM|nr:hypothetical protein [Aristaeella hokkaidonensis]QUC67250.1 hypothetical protein JYE49_00590 [Aristaeella hokkaidonensis]SNT93427.1 Putative cell wall binding repeat-containing protein [Aristaeella hokkaidonensis]
MKKRIIIFSILGIILFLLPLAVNAEAYLKYNYEVGWAIEDGQLYYRDSNKTKVTGDIRIDQIVYSFADDGHLKHMDGFIHVILGNEYIMQTYYIDLNDNLATGLTTINGDTYFFDENNYYMLTGCIEINGKNYLFAPNLVKNAWRYDYYADKDGIVDKTPGYRKIDDDMYYFDENGKCVSGFVEIDGEMHLFTHTGGPSADYRPYEQRGWVNDSGFLYYFDLNTGVMATGNKEIDGISYTFYNDGVLKVQNDIEYVDGMFQAFDNNSRLKYSGVIYSSDGNTYYVDSGVHSSYIQLNSGWSNIRGRWFYRYEEGGWPCGVYDIYDSANDTSTPYVFSKSGELMTGWTKIGSNYYLADSNGHAVLGWVYSGGKWYYLRESWETEFDQYGSMATGWEYIYPYWYFFDNNGAMCTGWQLINDKWYYFSNSGFMVTGWVNLGSSWYYMDQSGEMCTGWICVDNNWYYLNSDGSMVTGWKKINNRWYYMNADGTMLTGWLSSGNHWYYFNSSGAMVTGWYEEKKGNTSAWYWFDDNGAMVTGWKEINGQWEMFDTNGVWLYTWNGN